jgi:predicted O-methyltransferase YrrM
VPWGIRGRAKTLAWRRGFSILERLGVHITPVGFGSPVPEVKRLNGGLWSGSNRLAGVAMDLEKQKALLRQLDVTAAAPELSGIDLGNPFFGPLDAFVLFAMVRRFRPARIVEIGSGYSTLVMQRAAAPGTKHHVIDPYPRDFIKQLAAEGSIELTSEEVQGVSLEMFASLEAGDLLFIDSSHILRIGSDVQFEILDVLPSIKPGVVIHVHDIFWPDEYPRVWVIDNHWFPNEQYVLQAFLAFNDQFESLLGLYYLQSRWPAEVEAATGRIESGSSFWMRRREEPKPKA